jgi:3-oxoacyl-(acyl-carrier-protein) synthase
MSTCIAGMGWVTPLGVGLDEVWARISAGESAETKTLTNPESGRSHLCAPVPMKLVDSLARNPRLRRSSAISYFAVAAGLAALQDAGIAMTPELAADTAIVFAISSGGVIYTRKFYEQIVKQGAHAASPLLFPETVYNAPASHLAAQLGIDGASYTLVGDAPVGIAAMKFAEQLLDTGDVARVVVVGCEEIDWALCAAYRDWRLARARADGPGALLSEGAAAVVLAREGRTEVAAIHDGAPFLRRRDAGAALDRVYADLLRGGKVDAVIRGANGTFVDAAESAAIRKHASPAALLLPKQALGEALGASALMQVIVGALALEKGDVRRKSALVSTLGLNQQAGGLVLTRR